jgi:hypothetical protein
MAKFRDNATGNVFEFTLAHDIETMRKHVEYTEVKEESVQEETLLKKPLTKKKQLKEV